MPVSKNKKSKLSAIGEFSLIDLIQRNFGKQKGVIKGIGDDTAVLPLDKKHFLLFTTDMLMEGTHFTLKAGAKAIGHKALACSISDIVAMGGVPTFAVVSLGVRPNLNVRFVKGIYEGIKRLARKNNIRIVGGDTIKANKIIINVALLGIVRKNQLVTRKGAKRGDQIFVTGPLGGSLKSSHHLTFSPRLKESQFLAKQFKPSAMIDISDGLATDLTHLAKASSVGAQLHENKIPKRRAANLKMALNDGEDFELLFTVSRSQAARLKAKKKGTVKFYHIGEIISGRSIYLVDRKGKKKKLNPKGFTHF